MARAPLNCCKWFPWLLVWRKTSLTQLRRPWTLWPFSSSLALSHTFSLSRRQLMEISVLIYRVHTPPNHPTTGPLHKQFLPPGRLTPPHRLSILQISTPPSLPCPHNIGKSPMSTVCTLWHLAQEQLYVSLCNCLINSSLLYWTANSMNTGCISIFTHH